MLRAGTVALALALASSACSSEKAQPVATAPAVAGVSVGTVLDVSGDVTAVSAGNPRKLTVGDKVNGDDELHTGADGRITIELLHNRAVFSLAPGRTQTVASSPAWAMAAATAPTTSDEISAAAGRHTGEREVDTTVSLVPQTFADVDGEAADPKPKDTKTATIGGGRGGSSTVVARQTRAQDDVDESSLAAEEQRSQNLRPGAPPAEIPTPVPPPPPPPPPPAPAPGPAPAAPAPLRRTNEADSEKGSTTVASVDSQTVGGLGGSGVKADVAKVPQAASLRIISQGSLTLSAAKNGLASAIPKVAKCPVSSAGRVTLAVDKSGKVIKRTPNNLGSAQACVLAALNGVTFSATSATNVIVSVSP